jgi:hypothetical protein
LCAPSIRHSYRLIDFGEGPGDALLYVTPDSNEIVMMSGHPPEITKRFAFSAHDCLRDKKYYDFDFIRVSPDGKWMIAYGLRSNIPFDLWGHAGKHVSVRCVLDLKRGFPSGEGDGFEIVFGRRPKISFGVVSGFLYVTQSYRAGGYSVHDLSKRRSASLTIGKSDKAAACDIAESADFLVAGCLDSFPGGLSIGIECFRLNVWPPRRTGDATAITIPGERIADPRIRLSASGDFAVVHWNEYGEGYRYVVADIKNATIRRVATRNLSDEYVTVTGICADRSTNTNWIVIAQSNQAGRGAGRLLVRSLNGERTASYETERASVAIYCSNKGRGFWYDDGTTARFARFPDDR